LVGSVTLPTGYTLHIRCSPRLLRLHFSHVPVTLRFTAHVLTFVTGLWLRFTHALRVLVYVYVRLPLRLLTAYVVVRPVYRLRFTYRFTTPVGSALPRFGWILPVLGLPVAGLIFGFTGWIVCLRLRGYHVGCVVPLLVYITRGLPVVCYVGGLVCTHVAFCSCQLVDSACVCRLVVTVAVTVADTHGCGWFPTRFTFTLRFYVYLYVCALRF